MIAHTNPRRLEMATDADVMRERLENVLATGRNSGLRIATLYVPRVLPRPSGKILIQYRVTLAGEGDGTGSERILYGEYYPSAPPEPDTPDRAGQTVFWDDLNVRVWVFPADSRLTKLPLLFDAARFHETFGDDLENVGQGGRSETIDTRVLGYRLGRRCTVRVAWTPDDVDDAVSESREVIAKMSRRRPALALWTKLRQLELAGFASGASDAIVLPKHLFLHQASGTIFQCRAMGTSLHDLTDSALFVDGCAAASRAVQKLHAVRISGLPSRTADDEIEQLTWLTGLTGETFPDLQTRLRMALSELISGISVTEGGSRVVSHRDFYDKQVLFDGTRTVLLDYDTLATADPALDVGNFIAHLEWRAHQAPSQRAVIESGREAFCTAYLAADSGFDGRASWWTAATRLRLACLYAWRPRWRAQADEFLESLPSVRGVTVSP